MRTALFALAFLACRGPGEFPEVASVAPEVPATDPAPAPTHRPPPTDKASIGIRGKWTLEVRDPDGTVVSQRTVHNDYVDSYNLLVNMLASTVSPGSWLLELSSSSGSELCEDSVGAAAACQIVQFEATEPNEFQTLVLSTSTRVLILEGSATAATAGTIDQVSSHLFYCNSSVTPASCETSTVTPSEFTATTLDEGIDMKANQSLYVTLELSFATAT